jgi:branched-subunit amino acid ABC-type transport system permease component
MIQVLVNGMIAGSAYALMGLGFTMIYSCGRFFHIFLGVTGTAAAYCCYVLSRKAGLPAFAAIAFSVLLTGALAGLIERLIFRPLRDHASGSLAALLTSLGLTVVLQNILAVSFGNDTLLLRQGKTEVYELVGAHMTKPQLFTLSASIGLTIVVAVAMRFSEFGRKLRAVADDSYLAKTVGVPTDQVIMLSFIIGSALCGLAGILVGYDLDLVPTSGFHLILMAIVAAVVGGLGSVCGVFVGGIFLGVTQHLMGFFLPSKWQDASAFLVLVSCLIFLPQGFFGRSLKSPHA